MEILSPASNMRHIQVAIDNKANAVYGGLKNWNARNKAINFTEAEYNQLITMLHQNNIKFFLTLNILMLDNEIEEVITFLKKNSLPDAFIVTDIGLIQVLKQEFPNVPLHFSTQFGCHCIDDVNFVKAIGGTRAILSRELTLKEVEKIRNNTDIELECFIWGSQCLSFSGLCFFGSLINGGSGNRGKCITLCRDVYSVNENGHLLYVPDMDCINLISKLDKIDCLKLEGRRRDPKEIEKILQQISNKETSDQNVGYLYGTNSKDNNQYELINSRIKPVFQANELKNRDDYDVFIEYQNGKPIRFSNNYNNPNVFYVYSEIKRKYSLTKKNISIDLTFDENVVSEVLYVNYKGDGHTFFRDNNSNDDQIVLDFDELIRRLSLNDKINIYKIKFKKGQYDKYLVSKSMYDKMINYILDDCKNTRETYPTIPLKLNKILLETQQEEILTEFVKDKFVKVIYDISTIDKLKNIQNIIDQYGDKIIYKLPLFNWDSEDVIPYISKLENKEIMFTRMSQIYLSKNIHFKKKYADYTIYVWNKGSLNFLKNMGIQEFTLSPELDYETNMKIYNAEKVQALLCGKFPLVYTRNCFKEVFNCNNCIREQSCLKTIVNVDKGIDFEILCNTDYRYVLSKIPVLNDYSRFKIGENVNFRYIALGDNAENIRKTLNILKEVNFYEKLKANDYWKDSYECNIIESKS